MTPNRRRRGAGLLALGLAVLVGCGSAPGTASDAADGRVLAPVSGSPSEEVPSALDDIDDSALPAPLVDPSRVIDGGPAPDGIPPIDRPRFVRAGSVDWLTADEPVIALEAGGQARAYPVRIMIWHEIANDTVAGEPVTVTYCPLCNSALAFERQLRGRTLTFGTSGKLYKSALVMYDRQTESLFSQIEGRAIAGVLTGAELDQIPVQTITWQQWRESHPNGWVLSRETGSDRDYGSNPYAGYDTPNGQPFLFDGQSDPRLAPKRRVLGIEGRGDAVAVPQPALLERRVLDLTVGGRPVVAWAVPGLRSALDDARVAEGRRVGATGVFDPVVDGRRLTFRPAGPARFTDTRTGSRWNVLGAAVAGPLQGTTLRPVQHLDTFWFAWAAFRPETSIAGR